MFFIINNLSIHPPWYRYVEYASLSTFFLLLGIHLWRIFSCLPELWWLLFPSILTGLFIADLASGLVHWFGDTWGTAEFPILGPSLIRPFREHHFDQKAIVNHDFVETNGSCTLACLPVMIICLFLPLNQDSKFTYFCVSSLIFATTFTLFTNQIHKWAHMDHPPKLVKLLQKWHIFLNPAHHQLHHTYPFNKYYCITNGWLNNTLTKINFFYHCERLVTKITGIIPRHDDLQNQ